MVEKISIWVLEWIVWGNEGGGWSIEVGGCYLIILNVLCMNISYIRCDFWLEYGGFWFIKYCSYFLMGRV